MLKWTAGKKSNAVQCHSLYFSELQYFPTKYLDRHINVLPMQDLPVCYFTCIAELKRKQDFACSSYFSSDLILWFSNICVTKIYQRCCFLKSSLSITHYVKSVEKSEAGSLLFIFSTEMKGNALEDEESPQGRAWTSIHAQYYYSEHISFRGEC